MTAKQIEAARSIRDSLVAEAQKTVDRLEGSGRGHMAVSMKRGIEMAKACDLEKTAGIWLSHMKYQKPVTLERIGKFAHRAAANAAANAGDVAASIAFFGLSS